jgi:hypothetical protein
MASFKLPPIDDNAESWGPTTVPAQFQDVPFMPFGKGDRLGRIADFGAPPGRAQYQSERPRHAPRRSRRCRRRQAPRTRPPPPPRRPPPPPRCARASRRSRARRRSSSS